MVATLIEHETGPVVAAPAPSRHSARRSARLALAAVVAGDCAALLTAHAVVWAITSRPALPTTSPTTTASVASALVAPTWLTCLARQGMYHARSVRDPSEERRRLLTSAVTTIAVVLVAVAATGSTSDGRSLAALVAAQLVTLLVVRSTGRRAFRARRRRGLHLNPTVIVGDNDEARALAASLIADPTLGYLVVGMVPSEEASPRAIERLGATGAVVATTAVAMTTSNALARRLSDAGLHVELSSSLLDVATRRLSVTSVGRFSGLHVAPVRRCGWRAASKRALDVVTATLALVVLAPTLAAIALCIRLTSPGPVIFRQERVGRFGRPFDIFKFRTMQPGPRPSPIDLRDHTRAALFKPLNDPRITPVGRLLRKFSLDELPQLWNVLRGEMSLVGPRPALADEMAMWSPELHERLRVRPGITGLWQIDRQDWSIEHYARLDLYYVDNWSLRTDLAILGRTVPAVLLKRANR